MGSLRALLETKTLLREAARHRLLLLTAGPAFNGTMATLASDGSLHNPAVLVGLALAGIGGAGAFTCAAMEFGPRGDRRLFWAIALLSTVLVAAAALAGAALGAAAAGPWVRAGGALALLAVAAQVAGLKLPTVRGAPAPLALAAAGLLLEVVA